MKIISSPFSYQFTDPHALPISALEGQGLDVLKKAVEAEIVNSTGKHILDLRVDLSTPQLRWERDTPVSSCPQ